MADLWRTMWGDKPVGEVIGIVVGIVVGLFGIWASIRALRPPTPPPPAPPTPPVVKHEEEEEVAPEIDRSAYAGAEIVSLTNTPFERLLKADQRVAELLSGWPGQAQETIDYLMIGSPTLDKPKRRRMTHRDIRRACLRLVIETLQKRKQRATYGAVAGVVGGTANGLMKPYPMNPTNSWVVAADNGLPTGYSAEQKDTDLKKRSQIISDPNELRRWLASLN